MLLNTFEYVRPNGLSELLEVVDQLKQKKTHVIAGGTDLIPLLRSGSRQADHIIDLSGASLDGLVVEDKQARIGPLVTFSRLHRNVGVCTKLPAVAEAASLVGAIQCQDLATIGGNLCSAVPSLDSAPPLMVLDAKLRLAVPRRRAHRRDRHILCRTAAHGAGAGGDSDRDPGADRGGLCGQFPAAGTPQGDDAVDRQRGGRPRPRQERSRCQGTHRARRGRADAGAGAQGRAKFSRALIPRRRVSPRRRRRWRARFRRSAICAARPITGAR